MRVIYAVRINNRYRFYHRRHDDEPDLYSRLIGRVDDIDAHMLVDWCYEKQREGWSIDRIEKELQ